MKPPAPRVEKQPGPPWHSLTSEETLARLAVSAEGLGSPGAASKLAADGPNALREEGRSHPLRILLEQFKSVIIWILIAAGAFSALLGEGWDALAILAIVLLNAAIGFHQEFGAQKSIAALKKMTAPLAKVLRDGRITPIPAAGVVVGDVLVLEAGEVVGADARLLTAASLRCMEAILTGEPEAVYKKPDGLKNEDIPLGERLNMLFMGTSVVAGTGRAVVVATAMDTELGRIASLLQEKGKDPGTSLQRKLQTLGHGLVWAALGIVALLFGLGLLRGVPPFELLMTSISLAVAAVPEGLPAVVTVALSLGVLRMAKRRTLVRRLAAVETLGSTSVICTDKTGTLTLGEMTVRSLVVAGRAFEVDGTGYRPEGAVRLVDGPPGATPPGFVSQLAESLIACNNSRLVDTEGTWTCVGDPTEGALLAAGIKAGGNPEHLEEQLPRWLEFPFDSDRKRASVLRRRPEGGIVVHCTGAPGPLLDLCTRLVDESGIRPMEPGDRVRIQAQVSAMAHKALRVLGTARRELETEPGTPPTMEDVEQDLVFVGLAGMHDPPRADAKKALEMCRLAGIRVVMITGDHPETALAIAREIGIAADSSAVITGVALDAIPEDGLRGVVATTTVYARVSAVHKLRIIHALQANGEVVAMTGDGVNDAPAISGADIGIAMGKSGTEVTRQAADMIITDDSLATIVVAVEEGRGIYNNIRKTLQYLLAGNTGELLLMAACIIPGLPAPLLPIHLLWINLVTDGLPALCLATDPVDPDVMQQRPRPGAERIANRGFLRSMFFTGLLTAGLSFSVFLYYLQMAGLDSARSHAFAVLAFAELLRSFGARSETRPLWSIPFFGNLCLVGVVGLSILLQLYSQQGTYLGRLLKTAHLPLSDGLLLLALGTIPLLVMELVKVVRTRPGSGDAGKEVAR